MRILIISPTKLPTLTGNAITAGRIAQGLQKLGEETRVITPGEYSPELVEDWHPDIVHLLHATKSWVQPLTLPYVITLTGTDVNVEMQRQQSEFHAILARAASVTAISEALARKVEMHDIRVIHQAVDLPKSKLDVRKRFDLHKKRLVLLPSGVRSVKDPLYAVQEVAKVQEELDIDVLILGQVYEDDLLRKLRRPWVTFGQLDHEDMSAAYEQADLILNTSEAEGESNAVLEALSLRRPILAADISGNEIVPERCRFPKADGELAKKIPEALGERPCEVAIPSPEEEAMAYLDVYRKVLYQT